MTARVTTLKGPGAGLYYVEALPSYYLDAGEPTGRWLGEGARRLGLEGEVDDEAFLALMAGLDPASGEPLGRRYGDASVRGFDITASAPKSVSALFAVGDASTRQAVLDAHDAAVAAMAAWVEGHAHTATASAARWPPSTPRGSSPPLSASTPAGRWTPSSTPTW